jgi:hypothetical protein
MRALINVLTSVKMDMVNFLVVFMSVLFGFMILAMLSFGPFVKEFHKSSYGIIKVLQMSLPELKEFHHIKEAHTISPFMSFLFFIPVSIMFWFIFANIFLSMMMSSYEYNIG